MPCSNAPCASSETAAAAAMASRRIMSSSSFSRYFVRSAALNGIKKCTEHCSGGRGHSAAPSVRASERDFGGMANTGDLGRGHIHVQIRGHFLNYYSDEVLTMRLNFYRVKLFMMCKDQCLF